MKKIILLLTACCMAVMSFAQGTITYELNGGVWNDYGWKDKSDMFNGWKADLDAQAIHNVAAWLTLDAYIALENPFSNNADGGTYAGNACLGTKMQGNVIILNQPKWQWLREYVRANEPLITAAANTLVVVDAQWRYSTAAFWVGRSTARIAGSMPGWNGIETADFSVTGQPAAFQPAWGQAFPGPSSTAGDVAIPPAKKTDFTFLGWFDNPTFQGSPVTSTEALSGNVTLYAKWASSLPGGDISYVLNGGAWDGTPGPATYDGVAGVAIPNPVRQYYTFDGWYKNAEFTGAKVTATPVGESGNIILFAKWTIAVGGSISYELNGGAFNEYGWNSKADMLAVFNADWNTATGSSDVWSVTTPGSIISGTATDPDALLNLIATPKWKWIKEYILKVAQDQKHPSLTVLNNAGDEQYKNYWRAAVDAFFTNSQANPGGWNASANFTTAGLPYYFNATWGQVIQVDSYVGLTDHLIDNPLPREGYLFLGWFEKADFSGDAITVIAAGRSDNVKLFAKWLDGSSIQKVKTLNIQIKEGKIFVPAAAGQNIEVFNAVGQQVKSVVSNGSVTVISGLLQNQVYIVKVGSQTAKVIL